MADDLPVEEKKSHILEEREGNRSDWRSGARPRAVQDQKGGILTSCFKVTDVRWRRQKRESRSGPIKGGGVAKPGKKKDGQ